MKRMTLVSRSLAAIFGEIGAGEQAERRADLDADYRHEDSSRRWR